MGLRRNQRVRALGAAGLVGIGLFFIADHYHLPIIPAGDFGRGLWIGVCLGLEVLGLILLVKPKAGPAN